MWLKSLGLCVTQYIIYCPNHLFQNNYVDYIEDDEQVDVETVEELSEEINFTYKKTTAAHTQSFRQQ